MEEQKKGNAGWAVLGFFFTLVGLILWLVWKDSNPENNKLGAINWFIYNFWSNANKHLLFFLLSVIILEII